PAGRGVNPGMFVVRHTVKLQHGDLAVARLSDGALKISQRPVRARIARGGNQQRMIQPRFKREPATAIVGSFRLAAAPCETKAQPLENRQGVRIDSIAWISEADRTWNPVLETPGVDRLDLFRQSVQGTSIDAPMVAGVIADLKAVVVQCVDLFPSHVIGLVRQEGKA